MLDRVLKRLVSILEAKLRPSWHPKREPNDIWLNHKKHRKKTMEFDDFWGLRKSEIEEQSKKNLVERSMPKKIDVMSDFGPCWRPSWGPS